MTDVWWIAAWLLVLSAVPAAGQGGSPTVDPGASAGRELTIQAVRLDAPLRLDGVLDEPLYTAAPPTTDFLQTEPNDGEPASERTEVWVSFDGGHVYVSFRCFETDASRMVANEMRRDSNVLWQGDDIVAFMFDTFHDRRNSVMFLANAIGGRQDGQVTNERQCLHDALPIWKSVV